MARPAEGPKIKTSFSLLEPLLAAVREAAWLERITVTAYVERALREYLERNPPKR
jgi:hypothetical protein